MFRWNLQGDYPQIDKSTYIDTTATIVGKVDIGKNVFVGPVAVIRADEPGSSIAIGDNCNVQDRVIIHALERTSVLIEQNTSLAHGCIVHGPCKISRNCFIGFGSVVFNAEVSEGVIVKHLSCVEGVKIFPERVVESGKVINNEEDVKELKFAAKNLIDFIKRVVKTNLDLVKRLRSEQGDAKTTQLR